MKRLSTLSLISILLFAGCNQINTHSSKLQKPEDRTSNWPQPERELLKEFNKWLYKYSSQHNDIAQEEVAEAAMKDVNNYARNVMSSNFSKWVVKVGSTSIWGSDEKVAVTDFYVIRNDNPNDKYPQYSNIVLTTTVPMSDKKSLNILKDVVEGETVLLSGSFVPLEKEETISSNGNDSQPYNILTNPKFNVNVTGIINQ